MTTAQSDAREILTKAKYVSFTTFRKDGRAVASPVWFAPMGEQFAFMTNDGVGKTKRLAHTKRVEIQPCDVRGRVEPGAPTFTGTAVLVRDEAGQARARAAVTKKYGLLARGFELANLAGKIIPALKPAPRAAVVVTLDPNPSPNPPSPA